jgi:hypothetical protein
MVNNLRKIIKEEINDFDWADIDPSTLHKPYVGMKFRTKYDPNSVYEIFDLSGSIVYYKYVSVVTGLEVKTSIPIIYFNRYMKDGDWVTHYVNEDFDWTSGIPRKHDLDDILINGEYYWGGGLIRITNLEQKNSTTGPYFRIEFKWLDELLDDATNSQVFLTLLDDGVIVRKNLTEDFDWTDSISPETEWDKDKYYVLDITSLSGLELRETIDDIWDFAYNMDYDVEIGVTYDSVGYIYFEPNDDVPEGYALDWTDRKTKDPTFGGKYQMLSLEEFYHMAYGDEPSINEDFDWTESVPNPSRYNVEDLETLIMSGMN